MGAYSGFHVGVVMVMPSIWVTSWWREGNVMLLWNLFVLCGPRRQHRLEQDGSATRKCGYHKNEGFGLKVGSNPAIGTGCHTPKAKGITCYYQSTPFLRLPLLPFLGPHQRSSSVSLLKQILLQRLPHSFPFIHFFCGNEYDRIRSSRWY